MCIITKPRVGGDAANIHLAVFVGSGQGEWAGVMSTGWTHHSGTQGASLHLRASHHQLSAIQLYESLSLSSSTYG